MLRKRETYWKQFGRGGVFAKKRATRQAPEGVGGRDGLVTQGGGEPKGKTKRLVFVRVKKPRPYATERIRLKGPRQARGREEGGSVQRAKRV